MLSNIQFESRLGRHAQILFLPSYTDFPLCLLTDGQRRYESLWEAVQKGDVVQLELQWNQLGREEQESLKTKQEFNMKAEYSPLYEAVLNQMITSTKFLLVRTI